MRGRSASKSWKESETERDGQGDDYLVRADGVPLDSRHPDESRDTVAGNPEVVLEGALGGVADGREMCNPLRTPFEAKLEPEITRLVRGRD